MFRSVVLVHICIIHIIISQLVLVSCDANRRSKLCDSEEFYKPYVEILRKRGGHPEFEIKSPGFVDLRNQYGVLLCVNGPAYMYGNAEEHEEVTSKIPKLTVFSNATFKFYAHECFLINRPVKNDDPSTLPPQDQTGVDDDARSSFHRVGKPAPSVPLNENITVNGIRTYGISLLGQLGNYSAQSLYMFTESNFGHSDKLLVISSSFATVGQNEWECYDAFTNSTLTVKPDAKTELEFCSRPEGKEPFDAVFQRGHNRLDYNWTMIPLPNTTAPPTTPEPPTQPTQPARRNISLIERIGRIIDPKLLGLGGQSPHKIVGPNLNKTKLNATDFPEDYDNSIKKPHKSIMTQIGNCQPLPKMADFCVKPGNASLDNCKILTSCLQLDPKNWEADTTIQDLMWKKEVIDILKDIFIHICPQVNKNSVESVANVFLDMYVLQLHSANASLSRTKSGEWDSIKPELIHCKNGSTPLKFQESPPTQETVVEPPITKPEFWIEPIPPDNTTIPAADTSPKQPEEVEKPEILPKTKRVLTVKRKDGTDGSIFHYEEAAEADYEFNIGIDFQWKIFSTVSGYCNKFYVSKKSSVFPRLYSMFADEFLAPNEKSWTDPAPNHVFSYVMSGGNDWLDECLEGAYVHSDSEEYRPVRPLNINDGQHLNHFTVTPPHS